MLLSLLALPYAIPLSSAATYTLTLESYSKKPWDATLTPITAKAYLAPYGSLGGTPYTTPTSIIGLDESTGYFLKVPLSISVDSQTTAIFHHWEGATNILSGPRPGMERIDTNGDGVLDETYIVFTLQNTVGGNQLLKAIYELQWGPQSEHLTFHTVWGPTAQRIELLNGDADVLTDLIRTIDVDELGDAGNTITSSPGFHMCYVASNLRLSWMGPTTGGAPGSTLRKAIAYLLPKDTLIATLFKYIVGRLDTFVPPSLAEWYNPGVTKYDYSPTAAYNTLIAGGWTYSATYGTWTYGTEIAGGTDNTIQILSPLYEVAPTSFTLIARLVDEMNNLKNPTTLAPTPIKAQHKPEDFNQMTIDVFELQNFEMYFLCWGLSSNPDFLYSFFHSSQDVVWGNNSPGIRNPTLDAKLETIMFGMDHAAKVAACDDAQALLSDYLPYVPVYSRNYFNAHRPEYNGIVISPGYGINTFWTYANVHGPRTSSIVKPPDYPIQGDQTIWILGETPETYNPAYAGSVYAWTVLSNIYDGLIMDNPFTHVDSPWLAESWAIEGPLNTTAPNGGKLVNGMKITFAMNDEVSQGHVLWHDGEVFDAYDVEFAWEYVRNESVNNYLTFWEYLVDADAPNAATAIAYFNVTSQWLLYNAASIGALFPPQVWDSVRDDPGTPENEVLAYQPETHARPNAAYPWLTEVIGTGPYVFNSYTTDRMDTNLVAFDLRTHASGSSMPNLHYWKTSGEIKGMLVEMFGQIGDISMNGYIDITDISRVGAKSGRTGLPGWIQEDVVKDGVINIFDLATSGRNYGKQMEY